MNNLCYYVNSKHILVIQKQVVKDLGHVSYNNSLNFSAEVKCTVLLSRTE